MHNQVAVRGIHGGANLEHQLQPGADGKLILLAIAVEPDAFDILHHQVGLAVRTHAAIQQAGDVGMLQPRQQLALAAETVQRVGGGQIG